MNTDEKCDRCGKVPLFHVTEASNLAIVRERYLCDEHARELLTPLAAREPRCPFADPVCGGLVELDVEAVALHLDDSTAVVYLREVNGDRRFCFLTGKAEAWTISCLLRHVPSARPLTHQAMADTVNALGGQLRDVLVDELVDGHYHAKLRIAVASGTVNVDLRPSDGIALALVSNVQVLISKELLERPTDSGAPGSGPSSAWN